MRYVGICWDGDVKAKKSPHRHKCLHTHMLTLFAYVCLRTILCCDPSTPHPGFAHNHTRTHLHTLTRSRSVHVNARHPGSTCGRLNLPQKSTEPSVKRMGISDCAAQVTSTSLKLPEYQDAMKEYLQHLRFRTASRNSHTLDICVRWWQWGLNVG